MKDSREIIFANLERCDAPRSGLNFDGGRMDDLLIVQPGPAAGYTPLRRVEGDQEYYDDDWGNLWVRMVGGCVKGEILTPVLDDWSKLAAMKIPDYGRDECWAEMARAFKAEPERFRLAHIGGWIFDNSRYLRKLENYLLDLALYPDELNQLHEKVACVYETKIRMAARTGADGIWIGEDLGTQTSTLFSPEMFREYFKPLYSRLMGLAHELGMKVFLHSCGCNRALLDDLMDCGVDCFQFDQPRIYDMPELAAMLGRRKAVLWAPVDIQKVMPTGDRALIESEVDSMVQLFGGGLIFKNYPDLPGIGVKPEWDQWAYELMTKGGLCGD